MERNWHRDPRARVRDRLVQLLKTDIERMTLGAFWRFIVTNTVDIEVFRDGLVQDFVSSLSILWLYQQFDAPEQIRDKPVHPDHVVIAKVAFDSGRIEAALGKKGFGQVAEFANGHQMLEFHFGFWGIRWLRWVRVRQAAALQFGRECRAGDISQRDGVGLDLLQFAVAHRGIETLQAGGLVGRKAHRGRDCTLASDQEEGAFSESWKMTMVGAIGFEFARKRSFNDIERTAGTVEQWKAVVSSANGPQTDHGSAIT